MIRLTPEQISKSWDILRPPLAKSLPKSLGIDPMAMANILYSLLEEDAQLWVYYKNTEAIESGEPLAICMTAMVLEPIAKIKYLLVYALTAVGNLSKNDYENGLDTLRSFAAGNRCSQILAYAESDAVVRQLSTMGVVKVSTLMRL